ncbi:MAG: hypothetical protein ACM3NV_06460 [Syntrophothermus sp.]
MIGRRRLRVLGEIAAPGDAGRPWSLAARDLDVLELARKRLGDARVVLVTGADVPARVLAVGLAGAGAAGASRAVLVDCDLERSALAAELGLAPVPGLHEYLRWEATPQDVLQPLVLAGPASANASEPLVFVSAGRPAAEPSTLLGLQSFRHMSAKLRAAYDLVVLAGPPADAARTALSAVAAEADAALLALAPGRADRAELRALRAAVRRLGVETRGAVVVQRS